MPDRPDHGPETVQALHEVGEQLASLDAKLGHAERQARRRLVALALAVAVVLAAIVTAALLTFHATLDREHRILTECFLAPGRLTPAVVARCGKTFNGYAQLQAQSAARTKQFNDLLAQIPENRRRLDRVERELAELQE